MALLERAPLVRLRPMRTDLPGGCAEPGEVAMRGPVGRCDDRHRPFERQTLVTWLNYRTREHDRCHHAADEDRRERLLHGGAVAAGGPPVPPSPPGGGP